MDESNNCPACGGALPLDAPRGLCPLCLLQQGLGGDGPGSFDAAADGCVPAALSDSNGPAENSGRFSHALLRDTELGYETPVTRMTGPELSGRIGDSGRYQLFGEIARGGMGAILKGRDPDLGRDLAVKVLLEPHCQNPELIRRFIEEAQIGGQLQHPGIVPVHELGTFPDHRPYFTMKLVKGRTLAALLGERKHPGDDRPRFLGIFEHVCQTIAYAHARGVVHRDLKPANVMVGGFGEVQVMDWGLAKVLGATGAADQEAARRGLGNAVRTVRNGNRGGARASRAGSVLGTPAYMAPEQARGETDRLDERADVFGLGAILCEILSGQPPYVGCTSGDVQELAAGAALGDARARLDTCGAELELVAIAGRCLAPSPLDRPRDAGQVAADVTSYLRGVQERLMHAELARARAQAKAVEEKTRRRLAVGLAAAIVVLAATVAGGWMWRAREHERRAIRVDLALRDLVMLYEQAGVGGDDLARWATARAAARRAEQLVDDARDHATRSRVIALRDEVNEKLEEARSDAKLLIALAEIHDDIDDVPSSQTDAAFAATFRAARLDLEAIPPAEAGQAIARRPARVALALAAAIDQWAELRRNRRDCDGAALLTAAARAADPDEWRDRLRKALTECGQGAQRAALGELARSTLHAELPPFTLALLGAALLDAGDAAAAESVLRPAQRRFPGDLWLAQSLAKTLEKLSRRDEAIRYYMTARAVRPEAAHPLAHALERQGETDEAIAVFRELVRLSPTNARHLGCLGKALRSRGLAREANQALDAAIDAAHAATGLQPDDPMPHALLGMALRERGRLDEAITQYREAIRLGPNYVSPHINFGITLHRAGRADDAIAQYLESIRLQPDYAEAHCRLGEVLRDAKHDLDGSIAAFRQALRLEPNDASIHFNLGIAFGIKGQYDDAISEYRAAIHQLPSSALAHCNLGAILCDIKHDFDGAVAEFREAIRLRPDNAKAHYDLGNALQHSARNDEAIAAYRQALELDPEFAEAHCNLAGRLRQAGRFAESLAEFERGHELGIGRPDWPYPSSRWVEEARRLVQLRDSRELTGRRADSDRRGGTTGDTAPP